MAGGTDETEPVHWAAIDRLAPTAQQLHQRRRRRFRESFGFYLYALIAAIPFAILLRVDREPIVLVGLVVILAAIGALQLVRFRTLVARDATTDGRTGLRRIGATKRRLILDGEAMIELAWEQVEPPTLDRRALAWRFRLPYRAVDGEALEIRIGPAEVVALLGIRQRPGWAVTPSLLRAIEEEYRARGLPAPMLLAGSDGSGSA